MILCFSSVTAAQLTQVEGSLISLYIDKQDHDQSELRHYLRTKEGKAYKLHFKTEPKHPEEIQAITLKGLVRGRDIEVESYAETESSRKFALVGGTQTQAQGNQRTLVVPMRNSSTNTGFLYSSSTLNDLYFSSSSVSIQSYYNEVSDSAISFTGNVSSTIDVSSIPADQFTSGVCVPGEDLFDGFGWLYALDAIYQQHNLKTYDRVSVAVPNDSLCLGAGVLGVGSLGKVTFEDVTGARFSFSYNFVRSYTEPTGNDDTFVSVTAHEFGHNLGLKHDNGNSCGKTLFSSVCQSVEYGGAHSIMGFASNLAHLNAIHQEDLGWFSSEIVNVSGTQVDQTITISPMASDSTLPKAIKISRGDGTFYMIEYRKPVNMAANQAFNDSSTHDGFLVYLNDDNAHNDSILFRSDFVATGSALSFATTATFNTTFLDDVNGIQVIPVNLGEDNATLRVLIGSTVVVGTTEDDSSDDGGGSTSSEPDDTGVRLVPSNEIVYANRYNDFIFEFDSDLIKEDFENASIRHIKWDFDNDGDDDLYSYSLTATGYTYREGGTYTVKATIVYSSGTELVLYSDEFETVDYITGATFVKTKAGVTSSSEQALKRKKKTKLLYKFGFADSDYDGKRMRVRVDSPYRKYFKSSKKYSNSSQGAGEYQLKLVAKPEAKIARKLASIKTEDGYYKVPVELNIEVYSGSGSYYALKTVLLVKSSY